MTPDQKKIDEGNRLIAKFKGWFEEGATGSWYVIDGCGKYVAFSTYKETYRDLPFHRSWEWLMPVIEQIQAIVIKNGDEVAIELYEGLPNEKKTFVSIGERVKVSHADAKTAIWLAVIEFIKQTSK